MKCIALFLIIFVSFISVYGNSDIAPVKSTYSDESTLKEYITTVLQTSHVNDIRLIQLIVYYADLINEDIELKTCCLMDIRCVFASYNDVIFANKNTSTVREIYTTLTLLDRSTQTSRNQIIETCMKDSKLFYVVDWDYFTPHPYTWADKLIRLNMTKLEPFERAFYFYALWKIFTIAPFPPRYMMSLEKMMEQHSNEITERYQLSA